MAVGDTVRLEAPVTSPIPLSSARLVAPETDHDSVELWPAEMLVGEDAKLEMTGGAAGSWGAGGVDAELEPPPPPQPAANAATTTRKPRRVAETTGNSHLHNGPRRWPSA